MGFWDGSGISWTVSKQYAPRSSGAARGEASPLWVDVQKLCNVCFHCHGTSSYHTTHCTAAEQRATLIHRQYNRDWGTSYSRPPIYPYLTSPCYKILAAPLPRSRWITTPPDALPDAQPTVSKHWRQLQHNTSYTMFNWTFLEVYLNSRFKCELFYHTNHRKTVCILNVLDDAVSIQLLYRNALDIHCRHTASQLHVAEHVV